MKKITAIISTVSIGLFLVGCNCGNTSTDSASSKVTESDTSQVSKYFETREADEIPEEADSTLHATIKGVQVFWLLEEHVLSNYWPDKYEKIIQKYICISTEEDCIPGSFQIVNINDTIDLIIDYSILRNGMLGNGNYLVHSKKNKLLEKYHGNIEGIVKAPHFTGFIHTLRYMSRYYETYTSLEQITDGKISTRKILSYSGERIPDKDLEKHFAKIKAESAGNLNTSK